MKSRKKAGLVCLEFFFLIILVAIGMLVVFCHIPDEKKPISDFILAMTFCSIIALAFLVNACMIFCCQKAGTKILPAKNKTCKTPPIKSRDEF